MNMCIIQGQTYSRIQYDSMTIEYISRWICSPGDLFPHWS